MDLLVRAVDLLGDEDAEGGKSKLHLLNDDAGQRAGGAEATTGAGTDSGRRRDEEDADFGTQLHQGKRRSVRQMSPTSAEHARRINRLAARKHRRMAKERLQQLESASHLLALRLARLQSETKKLSMKRASLLEKVLQEYSPASTRRAWLTARLAKLSQQQQQQQRQQRRSGQRPQERKQLAVAAVHAASGATSCIRNAQELSNASVVQVPKSPISSSASSASSATDAEQITQQQRSLSPMSASGSSTIGQAVPTSPACSSTVSRSPQRMRQTRKKTLGKTKAAASQASRRPARAGAGNAGGPAHRRRQRPSPAVEGPHTINTDTTAAGSTPAANTKDHHHADTKTGASSASESAATTLLQAQQREFLHKQLLLRQHQPHYVYGRGWLPGAMMFGGATLPALTPQQQLALQMQQTKGLMERRSAMGLTTAAVSRFPNTTSYAALPTGMPGLPRGMGFPQLPTSATATTATATATGRATTAVAATTAAALATRTTRTTTRPPLADAASFTMPVTQVPME
ncbi:hypothetical protein PTSG_08014 [Salpingoeca rosetta]|uniref:BZIP domain-containing protein n=1 Tax=Salpingoeca rosetta (strain ATCC 50818 / BSB-021) TaxID=946362 RepID=F2UHR5_SALR5|nr:uncharacterized protein PTSG_08014 [Salpingoeca rosetta]EGD76664.1 hypothetical protein PTSG_08014 [Salpingoeca rosetta]|eukprot:XP_004991036.1 hypothetical protein PTSG_08014 [Salpingoeca rosetta]